MNYACIRDVQTQNLPYIILLFHKNLKIRAFFIYTYFLNRNLHKSKTISQKKNASPSTHVVSELKVRQNIKKGGGNSAKGEKIFLSQPKVIHFKILGRRPMRLLKSLKKWPRSNLLLTRYFFAFLLFSKPHFIS